jgi:hypothetical protein
MENILRAQNPWRTTEKILQGKLPLEVPKDIKVTMTRLQVVQPILTKYDK